MTSAGGRRDLRPQDGARFLLERTTDSGASAAYACSIVTPDREWPFTAVLSDDGRVALDGWPTIHGHDGELGPGNAPTELVEMLEMFAKLVARGATKRRDDGLVVWPARILRWRGPGR